MKRNLILILVFVVCFVLIANATLSNESMSFPVLGKVTSPFGYRVHPISGEYKFHTGIDIACVTGTPVKAPSSGTITERFTDELNGNAIKMKFKNGFTAGFAHLSAFKANVGDKVKKGQTIALSGSTGNSTGPHLHLTMRDQSGNYVDPLKYLK